jgi:hypothetical protein
MSLPCSSTLPYGRVSDRIPYEYFTNLLLHPYESSFNLGHVNAPFGENVRMGKWQSGENNLYTTAKRRGPGRSN